eukprot:6199318-Pleurochrysis_carterae.AAC.3
MEVCAESRYTGRCALALLETGFSLDFTNDNVQLLPYVIIDEVVSISPRLYSRVRLTVAAMLALGVGAGTSHKRCFSWLKFSVCQRLALPDYRSMRTILSAQAAGKNGHIRILALKWPVGSREEGCPPWSFRTVTQILNPEHTQNYGYSRHERAFRLLYWESLRA